MEIKVFTNISKEYENIEICINAPELTKEVNTLENDVLLLTSKKILKVIGMENNDIFLIDVEDIILFYSDDKYNYCKTAEGIYKIREKMYYLEENLPKDTFIRISNSVIINIKYVKCFNTDIIGKILVKFKDGSTEIVSRRRASEIMKFLKDRS